jgi:GNAT superfamily N-acetyltransferase
VSVCVCLLLPEERTKVDPIEIRTVLPFGLPSLCFTCSNYTIITFANNIMWRVLCRHCDVEQHTLDQMVTILNGALEPWQIPTSPDKLIAMVAPPALLYIVVACSPPVSDVQSSFGDRDATYPALAARMATVDLSRPPPPDPTPTVLCWALITGPMHDALLEHVYVAPSWRGVGLGSCLLTDVLRLWQRVAVADGEGAQNPPRQLDLYCKPSLESFYQRVGFVTRREANGRLAMRFCV